MPALSTGKTLTRKTRKAVDTQSIADTVVATELQNALEWDSDFTIAARETPGFERLLAAIRRAGQDHTNCWSEKRRADAFQKIQSALPSKELQTLLCKLSDAEQFETWSNAEACYRMGVAFGKRTGGAR